MRKSYSGFDIGQNKSVGAFFSGVRQQSQGETVNFHDTERMKGKEFVDKLIKQ